MGYCVHKSNKYVRGEEVECESYKGLHKYVMAEKGIYILHKRVSSPDIQVCHNRWTMKNVNRTSHITEITCIGHGGQIQLSQAMCYRFTHFMKREKEDSIREDSRGNNQD